MVFGYWITLRVAIGINRPDQQHPLHPGQLSLIEYLFAYSFENAVDSKFECNTGRFGEVARTNRLQWSRASVCSHLPVKKKSTALNVNFG